MDKRFFFLGAIVMMLAPQTINQSIQKFRGLASSWDIIPARSLAGLHYVFKDYELKDHDGIVVVKGPVIEITSGDHLQSKIHRGGYIQEIELEDFEREQELGRSVFEATTRLGNNVATAFLVGEDLVLTNRHVMSYPPRLNPRNKTCGLFAVKLNHKEEKVLCSKVRFCSNKYDYCLIEMKKMENGFSLGSEIKPLRLTNKIKTHEDALLLHIGNAAGLGLQASRGRGLIISQGEFYHYAPTLGGSSGAPLFNEKSEVIGVNWGHTGGNYLGESSFNRGVLSLTIYKELLNLGYLKTIRDIKSFRSWYFREKNHRKALIGPEEKTDKSSFVGK